MPMAMHQAIAMYPNFVPAGALTHEVLPFAEILAVQADPLALIPTLRYPINLLRTNVTVTAHRDLAKYTDSSYL